MINCGDCEKDGVFHQYAYEATSPHICDTSGYWTPDEAVGQSNSIRFWTSSNENLELSMCYSYISFIITFNVVLVHLCSRKLWSISNYWHSAVWWVQV